MLSVRGRGDKGEGENEDSMIALEKEGKRVSNLLADRWEDATNLVLTNSLSVAR